MKLVSVEQMHNFENEAINKGLSIQEMMENAGENLGKKIYRIAHSHYVQ